MSNTLNRLREIGDEIFVVNRRQGELRDEQRRLLDEWAAESCPLKIGDVVEAERYRRVPSKFIKIDFIAGNIRSGGPQWEVMGLVLKKDGTPGLRRDSLSQWAYEQALAKERQV